MDLVLVDANDTDGIRTCYEVSRAAYCVDGPAEPPAWGIRMFGALISSGWIGDPKQTWLAADGSGYYQLELPERDNRHMARLDLFVHPERRREGIGTDLLADATARVQRMGRSIIGTSSWMDSPGESFARDAGYKAGLTEILRMQRVGAVPRAALAAGYSLLTWQGPTPQEHADGVAAVIAMIADAPSDPSWEPEQWDAERVRLQDARVAAQGLRYYTIVARHEQTGELAALTQIAVDPERPGWGFQEMTAVTRAHRGHGLGRAVKTAMLNHLASVEPGVERIVTFNAEENKHMIAINEALGYEILAKVRWFESVVEPKTA